MLGGGSLGEFGESLVIYQILPSKFKQCLMIQKRKQTNRNSPKLLLSEVSDEKFTKVFLHQTFAIYIILQNPSGGKNFQMEYPLAIFHPTKSQLSKMF